MNDNTPTAPRAPWFRRINRTALAWLTALSAAIVFAATNGIHVPAWVHVVALFVLWVQHPTKKDTEEHQST